MAANECDDIFILQVLISTLTFEDGVHQTRLPVIKIEMVNGPEIVIPYRYSAIQCDVESVQGDRKLYKFEKGKSCLFASKIDDLPYMKFLVKVQDGESTRAIVTSESFAISYDPQSIQVQTLIKGGIHLYDPHERVIGELRLLMTVQLIGSHNSQLNPTKSIKINAQYEKDTYIHPLSRSPNRDLNLNVKEPSFSSSSINEEVTTTSKYDLSSTSTIDTLSSSPNERRSKNRRNKSELRKVSSSSLGSENNKSSWSNGREDTTPSNRRRFSSTNAERSSSSSYRNESLSSNDHTRTSDSSMIKGRSCRSNTGSNKEISKENMLNLKFKSDYLNHQEQLHFSEDFSASNEDDSYAESERSIKTSSSSSSRVTSSRYSQPMLTLAEEKRRIMMKKGKISSHEHPKGWLRSAPVFRGNILSEPRTQPYSTRSSFLKLIKNYPDIECKMKKEIEKKLKEKLKKLDEEYVIEIEKLKKRRKVRAHVPAFRPKPKSSKSKATSIIPQIDKETLVGESILEDDTTSNTNCEFDSEMFFLSEEDSGQRTSIKSTTSEISTSKKDTSSLGSTSWKEMSKSDDKSNGSSNSSRYLEQRQMTTNSMILISRRDSEFVSVNESVTTNATPSRILSHRSETSKLNSAEPTDLSNSEDKFVTRDSTKASKESTPTRGKLIHQASSKTVSSFYPETPEKHRRKTLPKCLDDIDSSVGDISAKIAALIVPREREMHSVCNTDSISSYEPSDLEEDLSSLSKRI